MWMVPWFTSPPQDRWATHASISALGGHWIPSICHAVGRRPVGFEIICRSETADAKPWHCDLGLDLRPSIAYIISGDGAEVRAGSRFAIFDLYIFRNSHLFAIIRSP